MNAELAVQKTIYDVLTANSPSYSVYDDVSQDSAFPYYVIGDSTSNDFDTKTFNGLQTTVYIHSWSRYHGKKEIKEMMGAAYAALHNQTLTVTGYNFVHCLYEFSEYFLEDDGITRHGIQRFNLIITEES